MADVDVGIIGESRLRRTEQGLEKEVSYRVYNLSAGTQDELEWNALDHVPGIGDPHPTIAETGFQVREQNSAAISDDTVEVSVVYRTPGASGNPSLPEVGESPRIEVGGRVTRAQTNVDRGGNKLTIGYSGDTDFEAIDDNVATVALAVPQFTYRTTRRETTSPDGKAVTYVGKVNSSPWNGQAAGKWLCEGIVGRSDDGGQTYIVSYEFGFREGDSDGSSTRGWAAHVFVRDPETGEIPDGVTVGDGEEFYDVYPQADFNNLALT